MLWEPTSPKPSIALWEFVPSSRRGGVSGQQTKWRKMPPSTLGDNHGEEILPKSYDKRSKQSAGSGQG
jgi:hypothetical protein